MGFISRTAGTGLSSVATIGMLQDQPAYTNDPRALSTTQAKFTTVSPVALAAATTGTPWDWTQLTTHMIPPIPNNIGWLEFHRIPAGSRNIHFKLLDICGYTIRGNYYGATSSASSLGHYNASIVTIHAHGGAMLTGIPISLTVLRKGINTTGITDSNLLNYINTNINSLSGLFSGSTTTVESYMNMLTRRTGDGVFLMWYSDNYPNAINALYNVLKYPTIDSSLTFPWIANADPTRVMYKKLIQDLKDNNILTSDLTCADIDSGHPKVLQIDAAMRKFVGDMLHTLWPSVVPANLVIDDRYLMGTGQMIAKSSDSYHTFSYDYETIKWTGSHLAGLGVYMDNHTYGSKVLSPTNTAMEELYIEEAKCDLIIGVILTSTVQWEASWDEQTDDVESPCYIKYQDTYPGADPDPEPEPEPEPIPEPEPEPIPEPEPEPIPEPPSIVPEPYYRPAEDKCIARSRVWRFRDKRHLAPTAPVIAPVAGRSGAASFSANLLSLIASQSLNLGVARLPLSLGSKQVDADISFHGNVGLTKPKSGYYTPVRK